MEEKRNLDWIDNYGFILLAFAHMTDWFLADKEIEVINDKLKLMLSQSNQEYSEEEVSKKLIQILHRYDTLKDNKEKSIMDALLLACDSLKAETWFDNLAATMLVRSLAEIAEADHNIVETEVQLLKNIADVFGVKQPRI